MVSLGSEPFSLMVVEDSDEDFEAMSRILRALGGEVQVQRCVSGDDCLGALGHGEHGPGSHTPSRPDLILLDLNLPGTDGREALRTIKTDPHLKTIPVTILTTSASPRDVEVCYTYGANAYVLKSLDYDSLTEAVRRVTNFWFHTAVLPAAAL